MYIDNSSCTEVSSVLIIAHSRSSFVNTSFIWATSFNCHRSVMYVLLTCKTSCILSAEAV